MTTTMRRPRGRGHGRWGRAATMLEFAIVLPIFLFMMLFTIDMGSIVLVSGAVNDAVFSTARTASQLGGAGIPGGGLAAVCNDASLCDSSVAGRAFGQAMNQIPFNQELFVHEPLTIVSGATCTDNGADSMVVVKDTYAVRLITPGLTTMLNMINGDHHPDLNGFTLQATGVSRCEIYRS